MFRKINDQISVSPQITLDQIGAAKAGGVTLIVNNRPDGEEPGAPQSAEIEAAAKAAGIDYVAIPVSHGGFSEPQVDAMIKALDGANGKILAYCRSGARSTSLWSLAQAKKGMAPDEIARLAGNAGYDITPVRAIIDALAGGAK
ncbi:Protein tyrosine phosphatase [hydrothermal vent metagenome]|uniref:Protein tyrosine phosphatase n=1 Tax=hydrothermal vent metagenome TaxID=652676 RepID=A0A3B0RN27_9ZZZZ